MCEANTSKDSVQIRELVLNARQPIILRNFKTNWTCFSGSLEEWCTKLGKHNFDFECMRKAECETPQWERNRSSVQMSVEDFLKNHTNREDCWLGLNYKRSQEMPAACKKDVDFSCLGFKQTNDDYSFWLSSAGANTPCHYDTYGCNIVVQVYGKKSWLLFPPASDLTSIRVPYEESSIYCLENFYAPNSKDIEICQQLSSSAYHCVLEPNDVLIVPRHWWHYVETLETSLSINAWIPLVNDTDEQINECIVKFLIESIIKGVEDGSITKYILNPNQVDEIASSAQLFSVIEYLINKQETNDVTPMSEAEEFTYQYLDAEQYNVLLEKIPEAIKVKPLSNKEFMEFLKENAGRRKENVIKEPILRLNRIPEILINSICSPNVIQQIKSEFYKRYKS